MAARILPSGTAVQAMNWGDAVKTAVAVPATRVVEGVPEDDARAREQAAFERGVQQGRASALAEASARVETAVARAGSAAAEIAATAPAARAAAQDDIVRLSIAIARRILRREVAVDPDALAGIALAALERLNGRETRRVRVHPEDAAAVERTLRGAGVPAAVIVDRDATLERGSLIFDIEHGNLDASVWTQLGEIERGLTERPRRGRA